MGGCLCINLVICYVGEVVIKLVKKVEFLNKYFCFVFLLVILDVNIDLMNNLFRIDMEIFEI